VCGHHLAYYITLLENNICNLAGAEKDQTIARLNADHDNFKAALEWASNHDVRSALRLADLLSNLWMNNGNYGRYLPKLLAVLALADAPAFPAERSRLLVSAGLSAKILGNFRTAVQLFAESLPFLQEQKDRLSLVRVLRFYGQSLVVMGQWERGLSMVNESVRLSSQAEDELEFAWSLFDLGQVHSFQQNYHQALQIFEECLSIHQRLSNQNGQMWALMAMGKIALHGYHDFPLARQIIAKAQAINETWDSCNLLTGEVAYAEGDQTRSREIVESVLKDAIENGYTDLIASSHYWLGWVDWRSGKPAQAALHFKESLAISRKIYLPKDETIDFLVGLASAIDRIEVSLRLCALAASLRTGLGLPEQPASYPADECYARIVATAKYSLSPASFQNAWQAGQSTKLEEYEDLILI
jgi:tetratricopeptide (TPR) repeat protein